MQRIYALFFFACPKKNEKRAPANDIQRIRGTSLDLIPVLMTFQQLGLDP
jgi:hypothetical protein